MNTTIEQIQYKLRRIGKQYLSRADLERILNSAPGNYQIRLLVEAGLISVIKNNTRYLNHNYERYVAPEAIAGLYCQNDIWMIGGLGIYSYYGFTTQAARQTTIYSTKTVGLKRIAGQEFQFYKKRESFFYGRERRQKHDIRYYRMSPERALIQLIIDSDGIWEFREMIHERISTGQIDMKLLQDLAHQHCSRAEQDILDRFFA